MRMFFVNHYISTKKTKFILVHVATESKLNSNSSYFVTTLLVQEELASAFALWAVARVGLFPDPIIVVPERLRSTTQEPEAFAVMYQLTIVPAKPTVTNPFEPVLGTVVPSPIVMPNEVPEPDVPCIRLTFIM